MLEGTQDFRWRDGDRTVVFEGDGVKRALSTLEAQGFGDFELLSTERAVSSPAGQALATAARAVHHVSSGGVPDASAELLGKAAGDRLVALGGGRVIDSAKAVAAITGAGVAALPTTLSGAEMTGIHRLPAGREAEARGMVRPRLVIADPHAMTDAPGELLRTSAMNALAHGAEATYGPFANPFATLCGLQGARLIGASLGPGELGDSALRSLALGALLCANAIDSAGLSLHHVISQTTVRVCGTPHAQTNAAVLPHSLEAMRPRAASEIGAVEEAIGASVGGLTARVEEMVGRRIGLGELGARPQDLPTVISQAGERLRAMAVPADEAEVEKVLAAAM